ncbi:hypothetical protein GN956_G16897 [Arapaima gigas]
MGREPSVSVCVLQSRDAPPSEPPTSVHVFSDEQLFGLTVTDEVAARQPSTDTAEQKLFFAPIFSRGKNAETFIRVTALFPSPRDWRRDLNMSTAPHHTIRLLADSMCHFADRSVCDSEETAAIPSSADRYLQEIPGGDPTQQLWLRLLPQKDRRWWPDFLYVYEPYFGKMCSTWECC